jgi:hypothetical protein
MVMMAMAMSSFHALWRARFASGMLIALASRRASTSVSRVRERARSRSRWMASAPRDRDRARRRARFRRAPPVRSSSGPPAVAEESGPNYGSCSIERLTCTT